MSWTVVVASGTFWIQGATASSTLWMMLRASLPDLWRTSKTDADPLASPKKIPA